MGTDDFTEIMNAADHAELTLLIRRIEFLRFKANTEIWQAPGWRQPSPAHRSLQVEARTERELEGHRGGQFAVVAPTHQGPFFWQQIQPLGQTVPRPLRPW